MDDERQTLTLAMVVAKAMRQGRSKGWSDDLLSISIAEYVASALVQDPAIGRYAVYRPPIPPTESRFQPMTIDEVLFVKAQGAYRQHGALVSLLIDRLIATVEAVPAAGGPHHNPKGQVK